MEPRRPTHNNNNERTMIAYNITLACTILLAIVGTYA